MGPQHLMVVGFEQTTLAADIVEALQTARDEGIIRLLDFLFVAVDEDGTMSAVEVSDLLEANGLHLGAVVSALTGAFWGMLIGLLFCAPHCRKKTNPG